MYRNYVHSLKKLAPFVEMKVRTREDWTNAILLNLIRERDHAKELYLKADDYSLNKKFEEFKELRDKVKRLCI